MVKKIVFVLFLILVFSLSAQTPPDSLWTVTYGDEYMEEGAKILLLDDGYIITGMKQTTSPDSSKLWLLKVDFSGNVIWEQLLGDDYSVAGKSLLLDDDAFIILAKAHYVDRIRILKTDLSGNILWESCLGENEIYNPREIHRVDDGYLIIGTDQAIDDDLDDMILLKTDLDGNLLWLNEYGGSDRDRGSSMLVLENGDMFLFGYTKSFGYENYNFWLIKTDSNGNILWDIVYDDTFSNYANKVFLTSDNNLIMDGSDIVSWNNFDIKMIKTDLDGNVIWDHSFGGEFPETSYDVIEDSNNFYILASANIDEYNSDVWLIKIDENGEMIWEEKYGDNLYNAGYSFCRTNTDGLIITGATFTVDEDMDLFLLCLGSENVGVNEKFINIDGICINNFPNPFNPTTTIEFSIQNISMVELTIFNIKGQKIKMLANSELDQGTHSVIWNGDNESGDSVSSGIYYYKLNVNGKTKVSKKCLLLK